MGTWETGYAVQLTVDLTRYDHRLVAGSTGTTTGGYSRLGDRFTGVRFDNGAYLDVLWESLDITDEEYLAKKDAEQATLVEDLRKTRKAVWHQGPRGGFYAFDVEYDGAEGPVFRTYGKTEGTRIREIIEGHGIPVTIDIV